MGSHSLPNSAGPRSDRVAGMGFLGWDLVPFFSGRSQKVFYCGTIIDGSTLSHTGRVLSYTGTRVAYRYTGTRVAYTGQEHKSTRGGSKFTPQLSRTAIPLSWGMGFLGWDSCFFFSGRSQKVFYCGTIIDGSSLSHTGRLCR